MFETVGRFAPRAAPSHCTEACSALQRSARSNPGHHSYGALVLDLVYILATIAFFALMLGYVRACERLGRNSSDTPDEKP
jgi:hypothetical protein